MNKYRMKLCDDKNKVLSFHDERLQRILNDNRNVEVFDNYYKWNYYKIR